MCQVFHDIKWVKSFQISPNTPEASSRWQINKALIIILCEPRVDGLPSRGAVKTLLLQCSVFCCSSRPLSSAPSFQMFVIFLQSRLLFYDDILLSTNWSEKLAFAFVGDVCESVHNAFVGKVNQWLSCIWNWPPASLNSKGWTVASAAPLHTYGFGVQTNMWCLEGNNVPSKLSDRCQIFQIFIHLLACFIGGCF